MAETTEPELYVLKVNAGDERVIVAGLREHYKKEELKGKHIVMVHNLAPAKLRGIESNGMLLAVNEAGKANLLVPDKKTEPGKKIS